METNINRRVFFQAATCAETVGALATNVPREDAKATDQCRASTARLTTPDGTLRAERDCQAFRAVRDVPSGIVPVASGASGVRLQLSPLWALSPIEPDTACVQTRMGRC